MLALPAGAFFYKVIHIPLHTGKATTMEMRMPSPGRGDFYIEQVQCRRRGEGCGGLRDVIDCLCVDRSMWLCHCYVLLFVMLQSLEPSKFLMLWVACVVLCEVVVCRSLGVSHLE